eukprot:Skav202331  [mRNA]  locus=scaffold60:444503:445933:+ [translate_table: standard]
MALAVDALEDDCQNSACSAQFLQVQAAQAQPRSANQPWPHARGSPGRASGTTPEAWTTHSLQWTFHDPRGKYYNLFAGGAVIDQDSNLFQMTDLGLYALNSTGQQLWHYEAPGRSNNEITLAGDLVLGTTILGNAFAVNRLSGKEVWVTKMAEDAGGDCGYPAAHDGIFVAGARIQQNPNQTAGNTGGNTRVFGLDVKNGTKLWEYAPDKTVWNLTPLFPGDGSCVFMDLSGGMYRINLATGAELWKTLPQSSRESYTDGGAGVGPKGPGQMVYTCSNPGQDKGGEGTPGIVRAFYVSNGSEAWYARTPMPCNSYPSIGHLAGVERLAVVVVPGSFMGQENLHGEILALDAATGQTLWSHPVEPYSGPEGQAAGDFEGFPTRAVNKIQPICLPAHWSAPLIDGKGTVMVGRANGKVYKVYGPRSSFKGTLSGNIFESNGTVAEVLPMGSAFLHGAFAAAPGMFAISSCDTLYVFKK